MLTADEVPILAPLRSRSTNAIITYRQGVCDTRSEAAKIPPDQKRGGGVCVLAEEPLHKQIKATNQMDCIFNPA